MGPTWSPHGSYRPQIGPMLAPRTLLFGVFGACDGIIQDEPAQHPFSFTPSYRLIATLPHHMASYVVVNTVWWMACGRMERMHLNHCCLANMDGILIITAQLKIMFVGWQCFHIEVMQFLLTIYKPPKIRARLALSWLWIHLFQRSKYWWMTQMKLLKCTEWPQ